MLARYFSNGDCAASLEEVEQGRMDFGRFFSVGTRVEPFPPLNVYEDDAGYHITADVPGADPAKLEITAEGNTITIKGVREADGIPQGVECYCRERENGEFSRSIRLPFTVDQSGILAKAVNGVLRLDVPKPAIQKPVKVPIKVE